MSPEQLLRRIWTALSLLAVVLIIGWGGFIAIEGFSPLDALYMTIITISTVGFREVRPLDAAGKVFTIFLILAGTGTLFYLVLSVAEFAIEGHLTGILDARKIARRIRALENHIVICGYGRVGELIARELSKAGVPYVVVEQEGDRVSVLQALGILHVEGDATEDHVLMAAGVKVARGLIAAVDTDAENVFVTLSAKALNPDLVVVARALSAEARSKLEKAGADRVVSPILIGAKRMASLVIHPEITDYLELISRTGAGEYRLEELTIGSGSPLDGKKLVEADLRGKTGALVMAIKHRDGRIDTNPTATKELHEGDHLIVLGTESQLDALRKIA